MMEMVTTVVLSFLPLASRDPSLAVACILKAEQFIVLSVSRVSCPSN